MTTFTPPPAFTTRPTLRGSFGMVSSTHWIASASAQAVLERGGNAFDAAVAGGFVLHIVEPHLNGPGGDMTAIVSAADPGTAPGTGAEVLMGQGPAPAGATIEHFEREGLGLVPGAGALAAAVPGAVDAWLLLLRERGTWELAEVLDFAIHYAREGHPVSGRVAATITAVSELFRDHWTSSADLWMPGGTPPEENQTVRNPAYADVLQRLVDAGANDVGQDDARRARIDAARRAWAHGFVAETAVSFAARPHRHSTGTDHAGVISAPDFAAFSASFEPATTLDFRGVRLAKTGPWGQGPVLLQTLAILDGFGDERLDPSTELGAHTILEALKLALADRDAYYGDPADPGDVPLETLLSPEYAEGRRRLIGERASHEFRPGSVPGYAPYMPPLATEAEYFASLGAGAQRASGAAGEPTVSRAGETRGDTCHIDVVDRWGNMVAATPSGGWLQSSPTVPGLGFCLGTRLQMTWLDQASPSALRPGRRPRTTLTPTVLLRDGRAVAALGSPGGDQQDQWQLLYLLRTIVGGYSPQEAIDAPMFHTTSAAGSFWPRTWEPGGAVVEDRLGSEVVAGLERRGHRVTRAGDWSLGRMCAVGVEDDGSLYAAANPRGMQGYAAGR
ncbi:gamma-glutamyltransferase family protein [Arthrobacter halodurans]|uniref:Gamma-glutamyltransferase family protein n=1 Tax=Arthrobacter halodurans TaxID=516699 RepID=A0ABV4UHW6_9MICC